MASGGGSDRDPWQKSGIWGRIFRLHILSAPANSGRFIRCRPIHNTMSKGAETARLLKSRLPQHADDLEIIAENFDGLEEDFAELDRVIERLNSRLR